MGGRVNDGRPRAGLSTADALTLFDAAMLGDDPLLVPIRLDLAALEAGAQAGHGGVPPMLRGLVRGRTRRSAQDGAAGGAPGWLADLALLGRDEQHRMLLDLVRARAAAVLRHDSPDSIEPGGAFSDLGFDSLTAIELRNGLGAATGLRLPATVVFDYPTPADLAGYLHGEMVGDDSLAARSLLAELDRMEHALASVSATDAEGGQILVRLQALTMKWGALQGAGAAAATTDGLQTATDDELFDFIDRDLGLS